MLVNRQFVKIYNVHRYFLKIIPMTFLSIILGAFFFSSLALAQAEHPEVKRTRGFDDYKKQKKLMEREREKGLALHLEKLEIEKREYDEAMKEYRRKKSKEKPLEETQVYREYVQERREQNHEHQQDMEEFKEYKRVERRQLKQAHLNEMDELGLPEDRPRYDVKKRVLYGATTHFGKVSSGGGGGGNSWTGSTESSGFGNSNDNDYAPPASSFDEFPQAPTFPGEDGYDLPPPPPPPFDDDGQGMNAPFDEFPPPPPPPVDDFNF